MKPSLSCPSRFMPAALVALAAVLDLVFGSHGLATAVAVGALIGDFQARRSIYREATLPEELSDDPDDVGAPVLFLGAYEHGATDGLTLVPVRGIWQYGPSGFACWREPGIPLFAAAGASPADFADPSYWMARGVTIPPAFEGGDLGLIHCDDQPPGWDEDGESEAWQGFCHRHDREEAARCAA